ncbi:hypothetical protein M3484_20865 [Pseudomonas sp. GX19020]|uniref:hypothetical protein n=1 Tax=Pseudomonas sp. GX19020 TaxID=2942277 RepID=UPI002019EA03|nr:hypothetical protein [Pseudomonas sp. GX19020]MCL4069013.1 hypothetical protein [Pseudomonas sp. GX19020]
MFFTHIAGFFAAISLLIGVLFTGYSLAQPGALLEKVWNAGAGVSLILAACIIGTLVEISLSVSVKRKP